ncbi:MAG: FHA domain-containing protein [Spirochaetaceae bacterium]
MDETISLKSNVGKRLEQIQRSQNCNIIYKGRKVPLVTKITIGRNKANDIVLDHILISRFHAEIQKIDNEYFIKDLDSSNNTYVNNDKIISQKYIKLNLDDVIHVGKTQFKIHFL